MTNKKINIKNRTMFIIGREDSIVCVATDDFTSFFAIDLEKKIVSAYCPKLNSDNKPIEGFVGMKKMLSFHNTHCEEVKNQPNIHLAWYKQLYNHFAK